LHILYGSRLVGCGSPIAGALNSSLVFPTFTNQRQYPSLQAFAQIGLAGSAW